MVPANRSSHVFISARSAAVGSSGYRDAIEWSVIHPNGPQMDVITLSKEIRYFKKPPRFAAFQICRTRSSGAFLLTPCPALPSSARILATGIVPPSSSTFCSFFCCPTGVKTRIVLRTSFIGGLLLGLFVGSSLARRVCRVPLSAPIGYVLWAVALRTAGLDLGSTRRLFLISGVGWSLEDFTKTCLTWSTTSMTPLLKNG